MTHECKIDREWAKPLVHLWMFVPNNCWKDYKDNRLHQGPIVMFVEDTNTW